MVQFNWKGTWLPNLPYNTNVVVEYDSVNYISNQFVPPTDVSPYLDTLHWDEMLVIFNTPTPTPSVTPEPTITPTPSVTTTNTPSPTSTPESTPAQTPTSTPESTPTPTPSPIAITGFGYTLIVEPYNPPSSGNTLFTTESTPSPNTGTTNPNTFDINGVYWNSIDYLGVDRTYYYSSITGNSVTVYFTQNSDTAIYSGTSTAFVLEGTPGLKVFNYNALARPGELTLIQSASTNFVTGQTVFISYTTI